MRRLLLITSLALAVVCVPRQSGALAHVPAAEAGSGCAVTAGACLATGAPALAAGCVLPSNLDGTCRSAENAAPLRTVFSILILAALAFALSEKERTGDIGSSHSWIATALRHRSLKNVIVLS